MQWLSFSARSTADCRRKLCKFFGEWGQDGDMHVYQVKFFEAPLKSGQKSQITDSFETAKKNPRINLKRWTLCLPCRLTQDCQAWFASWKKSITDDVEIQLLMADARIDGC